MKPFILAMTLLGFPQGAVAQERNQPLPFTCRDIRMAVAVYGRDELVAWARARGVAEDVIAVARRCIASHAARSQPDHR